MTSQIWKVQLPIETSGTHPTGLAYRQGRADLHTFSPDDYPQLNGKLKSFWYGRKENGVLVLDREAPWQEW